MSKRKRKFDPDDDDNLLFPLDYIQETIEQEEEEKRKEEERNRRLRMYSSRYYNGYNGYYNIHSLQQQSYQDQYGTTITKDDEEDPNVMRSLFSSDDDDIEHSAYDVDTILNIFLYEINLRPYDSDYWTRELENHYRIETRDDLLKLEEDEMDQIGMEVDTILKIQEWQETQLKEPEEDDEDDDFCYV